MTRRRLLLASLSAAWLNMVIACSGSGARTGSGDSGTDGGSDRDAPDRPQTAARRQEEDKAETAPKTVGEEDALPPHPEAPHPTVESPGEEVSPYRAGEPVANAGAPTVLPPPTTITS
jgi:hypothetical protein